MNWQVGVGVVLQGLIAIGLLTEGHTGIMLGASYAQTVSAMVAAAGAALILAERRSLGARLVIAGSVLFVPLGMLAIIGARQVLESEAWLKFSRGA